MKNESTPAAAATSNDQAPKKPFTPPTLTCQEALMKATGTTVVIPSS